MEYVKLREDTVTEETKALGVIPMGASYIKLIISVGYTLI